MDRTNRRATTEAVRSNAIFGIMRRVNNYPAGVLAMHYRRRFTNGNVYTGKVQK